MDDGSDDNTQDICKDFPDIIYIYQNNQGVSAARNTGIQHATHEWIAFLDSDDTWKEEKLSIQKKFHRNNPACLVSYTDEVWIKNNQEIKIPKKFHKIGKNAFLENIEYCNIAPSSVMMHQVVFDKVGMFDTSLEICEDYDLWLRIALQYDFTLINQKLIHKYAGHQDQLSFTYWGMDRWRVKALEKHSNTQYQEEVLKTLIKKYTLLKKGAMKYDKIASINEYEQKLHTIKGLLETITSRE